MKRLTILVVLVLVLASAASAQWRDYEWGMTPDQIRAEEGPAELNTYPGPHNLNSMYYCCPLVLGEPTAVLFLFEGHSLNGITLTITAELHDRAAVCDDRYLNTRSSYFLDQYISYDRDLMLEVNSRQDTTEIYYVQRSWYVRSQEQQHSNDSQEL